MQNVDLKGQEMLRTTLDNVVLAAKDSGELRNTGGGMVGALFSLLFVNLFAVEGTKIIVIVLASFGLIMLFDINLTLNQSII